MPRFASTLRHAALTMAMACITHAQALAASPSPQTPDGLPTQGNPGMFSGGLFSALFTGESFTGPRLADIVIIGLALFMLFRFLTGRRRQDAGPDKNARPTSVSEGASRPVPPVRPHDTPSSSRPAEHVDMPSPPPSSPSSTDGPASREPTLARAYQAAESAWGGLRSVPKPEAQVPGEGKPAFASQDEEFLAGAKAVYARIREAMEKGDVSGVMPFVATAFQAELGRMAALRVKQTGGKTSQLFLIDAAIDSRRSSGGQTLIDTRYEVVGTLPGASGDDRTREIWTFGRNESVPGSMWLLTGIRPV